jgi:hypothetical protein
MEMVASSSFADFLREQLRGQNHVASTQFERA